jgi:nucleoside-diphosphate-sugar epimerase
VLITGHNGYIGSVMAPLFVEAGYEVTGLDTGYFQDCTLVPDAEPIPSIRKDIRDLQPSGLEGFDAVVHLAALSNDPIGNLNPAWTEEINVLASARLAELAKRAGVRRFLFSSSCIIYGMSEAAVVNEESPLDPKTEYARSKVEAERAISRLAGDGFSPTFLRNGTVYGVSPRMRFDTVLNNLMGAAVAAGKVELHGDGQPWRPVVHVQDLSRSFLAVLEAPVEAVHNQVFNTGADHVNCQIIELAEAVLRQVPGARLRMLGRADADQRTYKASFEKFARAFPKFRFEMTLDRGVRELYEAFRAVGLTAEAFADPRFTRLKWLRRLLDSGRLDSNLRWTTRQKELGS